MRAGEKFGMGDIKNCAKGAGSKSAREKNKMKLAL